MHELMNRWYIRHFPHFGKDGQNILFDAKVLVIGAGGLGCSVLYNIASAGVGNIGIVDFDRVSVSNLNRQILYDNISVNQIKVNVAKKKLQIFNPDCKVATYINKIQDCSDIIQNYEIIADCSDNFEARFFINKHCHKFSKILISGAVVGYSGYVMVIKSYLGDDYPCYRCFCSERSNDQTDTSCEGEGVLGAVANAIGSILATKIVQEILQIRQQDPENFFRFDFIKNTFGRSQILKDKSCSICKLWILTKELCLVWYN